eukprot:scaffold1019_cov255-Pinguiococcus_pyrenoidosus.AAC.18
MRRASPSADGPHPSVQFRVAREPRRERLARLGKGLEDPALPLHLRQDVPTGLREASLKSAALGLRLLLILTVVHGDAIFHFHGSLHGSLGRGDDAYVGIEEQVVDELLQRILFGSI